MLSQLFNPAKNWPDNMSAGRDTVAGANQYPAGTKPTFLLPLQPKNAKSKVFRNYSLLLVFAFLVGGFPILFGYFVGVFSLVSNLLTSLLFGFGIFLWSYPGATCRNLWSWLGCLTATLVTIGLFGVLQEPYVLGIMFIVVFSLVANNLLLHGIAIRSAAPLSQAKRKKLIALYRGRFKQFRPVASVHLFLLPALAITVLFCAWQWPWLPEARELVTPRFFTLGLLAFVWLLPLFLEASIQFSDGPKKHNSVFAPYSAGLKSIHSWLTYNLHGSRNPAGFLSPAGTWQRRTRLLVAALIFVTPVANAEFQKGLVFLQDEQLFSARKLFSIDLEEKFQLTKETVRRGTFVGPKKNPQTVNSLNETALAYLLKNPKNGRLNPDGSITIFPRSIPPPQGVSVDLAREYLEAQEAAMRARVDQYRLGLVTRSPAALTVFATLTAILTLFFLLVPLLTLIGLLICATGRAFAMLDVHGYALPSLDVFSTKNWNKLVNRLRESDDNIESNSVLMGVCETDGSPILLPRTALREHVHFLGSTGSGKTALGLGPLLSQLMRFDDCSVVVIDLKGDDNYLFEELAQGQANRGGKFSYFTPEQGKGSHAFNLFRQPMWRQLSVAEKADLLTTGLGLFYGTDYGRKYYSDSNFALIEAALNKNPNVSSFASLQRLLNSQSLPLNKQIIRDSTNSQMVVERLSRLNVLNLEEDYRAERDLDLQSLFHSSQAWFLSMPTSVGSTFNADIARLISFSMLAAAKYAPKPRKQVYLVIDEFQRMLSSNLEIVLQLARSHDISVILANQSIADLERTGTNLVSAVSNNTRVRQYFAATSQADIDSITQSSGEYLIRDMRTTSDGFLSNVSSIFTTHVPSPRIRVNDILAASDDPMSSIFFLRSGAGYAQFSGLPVIARSVFHIDAAEHQRRSNGKWPNPATSPCVVADMPRSFEIQSADAIATPPEEIREITTQAAGKANPDEVNDLLSALDQEADLSANQKKFRGELSKDASTEDE